MEQKPGEPEFNEVGMTEHLRKESKKSYLDYEWAIHKIGQRVLPRNQGRRIDTLYTSALFAINLYERIILGDSKLSMNGQVETLRKGEASEEQILAFLNTIDTVVPQKLEDSTHPTFRLRPQEIIGLGALCGLPEDKKERTVIRKAVKGMFEELERTTGRKFGQKLANKYSAIFNGQPLVPGREGLPLTAAYLQGSSS